MCAQSKIQVSYLIFDDAICCCLFNRAFGEASAQGHLTTAMSIEVKDIPEARLLWEFSPNPFAHANPKECYTLSEHGTRNAYW